LPSKSSKGKDEHERQIRSLTIFCESPAILPLAKDAARLLGDLIEPMTVKVESRLFSDGPDELEQMSGAFVGLRLTDPAKRDARIADSFAVRDFEKRVIAGDSRACGVPYAGLGLMRLYQRSSRILRGVPEKVSVILTERLIMTWSEDDLRYHARVAVFGFPCIVSTSGIVEAPARPREYYIIRQMLEMKGIGNPEVALVQQFSGRYLETDDARTEQVLRGYLAQCLFYSHGLQPFCDDRDCMLFNAHWQEEMIRAQVESGRLCASHAEQLRKMVEGASVAWTAR